MTKICDKNQPGDAVNVTAPELNIRHHGSTLSGGSPMVHISVIQKQLTDLGIRLSRWFTPELRELQNILMDNEKVVAAAPGRYYNGFALLVATDLRLLLVDKRTFFMNIEDTRYDMISEINFSTRLYDLTVHIFTLNKQHNFTTIKYKDQLRDLCDYVQQRVWDLRQIQQVDSGQLAADPAQPRVAQPAAPPPSATTVGPTLPQLSRRLRVPRVPHPSKPHLPKHIGFAAMNGSRRYSPPVYTNHLLTRNRPYVSD